MCCRSLKVHFPFYHGLTGSLGQTLANMQVGAEENATWIQLSVFLFICFALCAEVISKSINNILGAHIKTFLACFAQRMLVGYFAKVCLVKKHLHLLHGRSAAGPAACWSAVWRNDSENLCPYCALHFFCVLHWRRYTRLCAEELSSFLTIFTACNRIFKWVQCQDELIMCIFLQSISMDRSLRKLCCFCSRL